jgi:hypothetical protein
MSAARFIALAAVTLPPRPAQAAVNYMIAIVK